MTSVSLPFRLPAQKPSKAIIAALCLGLGALAALLTLGTARLGAQVEGDRGIAPVAMTRDIMIGGITVNTTGKSPQEARDVGWVEARKKAWAKLGGPAMSDGQIAAMVAAIVIEREQIGPHRYIASLGVIFARDRAGGFVGTGDTSVAARSAPLLIIPVLYSGGVAQVYEARGPWQAAWAQFNSGASAIDYVRPAGSGGDSLLITAGQITRRSRSWWANILSQFQASDVLIPEARLERQWPGGPVRGVFTARYGPDNTLLESFTLTANTEDGVPAMLAEAVRRIDTIYNGALTRGLLRPDPSLRAQAAIDPALAAMIAAAAKAEGPAPDASASPGANPSASTSATPSPSPTEAKISTITVQFASPDARAVDAAVGAVRSVPGVKGASTTSLAMGGTSVMRVTFAGTLEELRAALQARGWSVSAGSNALSIRR